MREEINNWLQQAKKDFIAAKNSLNSGDYEWASFQAHQSVEKGLKSIYIKKYKEIPKVHDLVLLARKINAPERVILICSEINPSYLDTRYPDVKKSYNEKRSEKIILYAQEVLQWIEKNL